MFPSAYGFCGEKHRAQITAELTTAKCIQETGQDWLEGKILGDYSRYPYERLPSFLDRKDII